MLAVCCLPDRALGCTRSEPMHASCERPSHKYVGRRGCQLSTPAHSAYAPRLPHAPLPDTHAPPALHHPAAAPARGSSSGVSLARTASALPNGFSTQPPPPPPQPHNYFPFGMDFFGAPGGPWMPPPPPPPGLAGEGICSSVHALAVSLQSCLHAPACLCACLHPCLAALDKVL